MNKYPAGTVHALLQTQLTTPQTKQVLQRRITTAVVVEPQFFSLEAFEILQAVCNRLIPQQRQQPVDIAGGLDTDLAGNKGNGWRYNTMPPDQEAFKSGLNGINESAEKIYQTSFIHLPASDQDTILETIQKGQAPGCTWELLPGNLFFEELLSRLVEIYYSHPLAKDEIGDVSFADANGWQHIQLNEKDPQEPLPIGGSHT